MRFLFLIILLCNTSSAIAEDFDVYCKKNLKGKYTSKKKKNICWCVEDNLRSQLSSDDRIWLFQTSQGKKTVERREASAEPNETQQKRIKDVEFQVFKNCSVNYKWKVNHDDLGVPDDITAP